MAVKSYRACERLAAVQQEAVVALKQFNMSVAPISEVLPVGQETHVVAPTELEYVPMGQKLQVGDVFD